ncbi:MAG: type II toxin-antitoxin system prevent-host-death family antitoxin [Actinomycetota bacterium]|jgi:prevent-host-death family protein|nr:type II toxin-antitoxin system prevent-host-death family antitoxin [Actinomycetota bacterium]
MDVGIRELKEHLSELVERAANGEVIRVTDRGRPKAMLAPLPGRIRLEEGLAEGWIRRPSTEAPVPARRHRASRSIAEVLDEDRGP